MGLRLRTQVMSLTLTLFSLNACKPGLQQYSAKTMSIKNPVWLMARTGPISFNIDASIFVKIGHYCQSETKDNKK